MKSKLIIVGGFLGSGKTSLLWSAAKHIKSNGQKVGLITNDQASELVDTSFLQTNSNTVREVSGSCFCCNFNGFAEAIKYISNINDGGIIIAEPVGSCTDLSATLMQPIKDKFSDNIDLAPLTVLADPFKLKNILSGVYSAASYIILKQFEEADIILINKTDLISKEELEELKSAAIAKWKNVRIMYTSLKDNTGIKEWLDTAMSLSNAGTKIADVDYDIYAAGEAAYGWLNAKFEIERSPDSIDNSAREFLNALSNRFEQAGMEVGHVKFILQTRKKLIIGNLTGKADTKSIRKYTLNSNKTTLIVNARVETTPGELKNIIMQEVTGTFNKYGCVRTELKCLTPGRPNPTYRYNEATKKEDPKTTAKDFINFLMK